MAIITIPLGQPANAIGGKQALMLESGKNGGVVADLFGTTLDGRSYSQSLGELQEEEYEALRAKLLHQERATLPPFASFKTGNTIGKVVGETGAAPVPATKANPAVEAETPKEASFLEQNGEAILDGTQAVLDAAGLFPGIGEVADVASGLISLARGDYIGASLSFASAVPFAGWAASGAKAARRAVGAGKATTKGAEEAAEKAAKEAAEKAAKEAAEKAAKEKAAKEAAEAEAKAAKEGAEDAAEQGGKTGKDGKKVEKKKPHPDCGKVSKKYRNAPKEFGELNADHVPSGAALKEAAENELRKRKLWDKLGVKGQKSILDRVYQNAPTISIPEEVHKAGRTYGHKNNREQIEGDARDLHAAFEKDTKVIQEEMDKYDKGCGGAYAKAVEELRGFDYDALIDEMIKTSKYVKQG